MIKNIKNSMTGGNIKNSMKEGAKEEDNNFISSFELYPKLYPKLNTEEPLKGQNLNTEETTKKAPTKKNKNPILQLPNDLQIIINEYAQDKTQYKIFNNSYDMYYKLYKNIRSLFNSRCNYNNNRIKIINEYEEDNKNFILMIDNKNFYVELKTEDETETERNEYLKDNISYIYNNVSLYSRCLKDKFYKRGDFNNGMLESTKKKIKKAIEEENHILIYNMLDLDTFYYNYFRFNNICDFLNLYDYIDNIKIIENGELEGTRRRQTYNILIREN